MCRRNPMKPPEPCKECECVDGVVYFEWIVGYLQCPCHCHQEESVSDKTEPLDLNAEKKWVSVNYNYETRRRFDRLIKEVERLRSKILQQTQGYLNRKARQILAENADLREEVALLIRVPAHIHKAFYNEDDVLLDKCAKCGLGLRAIVHRRG